MMNVIETVFMAIGLTVLAILGFICCVIWLLLIGLFIVLIKMVEFLQMMAKKISRVCSHVACSIGWHAWREHGAHDYCARCYERRWKGPRGPQWGW